jgi:hypothetical protein
MSTLLAVEMDTPWMSILLASVGDPNPEPDPHVFGAPGSGSGSNSRRY